MKTFLMAALLTFGMGGAALADPVEGLWKTQPDDGAYAHVRIAPCGAAFCGVIERTFKGSTEYQSPTVGKKIVIDMVAKGDGSYAGQVWRPSNGKTYTGKMELSGDTVSLAGCVAGGLICSKQSWTRIN